MHISYNVAKPFQHVIKLYLFQMNNMANIVTSTLASAKAAASGASTANQKGDAFNPQDII